MEIQILFSFAALSRIENISNLSTGNENGGDRQHVGEYQEEKQVKIRDLDLMTLSIDVLNLSSSTNSLLLSDFDLPCSLMAWGDTSRFAAAVAPPMRKECNPKEDEGNPISLNL